MGEDDKNVLSSPMNSLPLSSDKIILTVVGNAGDRAAYRFLEFFTAQIRNPHTRPGLRAGGRRVLRVVGGP